MESISELEKIGIIYQDIKPDNILIKKIIKDGETFYKFQLSDFGGAYFIN